MGSDPQFQALILIVGVWGGAIAPVVFAVYYTCIARWWENPLGRTLIALDLCIGALRWARLEELFDHQVRSMTGPADWLVTVAMLCIPAVIIWRMAGFERKRRRMKREARKAAEVVSLLATGLLP